MTTLAAILILFVFPLALVVLGRFNIRAGYLWFVALGGAIASWVLVLVTRPQIPMQITLMQWQPESIFSASPQLLIDDVSWLYAIVIAVFPFAILITDIVQFSDIDSGAWATSMAMTGLGLLAVLAANPLTLVLAWVIMDIVETFILLNRVDTSKQRERVVVAFSVRLLGVFGILGAGIVAVSRGFSLSFASIPSEVSGLILIAVGLRLGVIPPHQPFFQEPPLRRGLGTVVRLAPVVSGLALLTRLADVGVPQSWQPFLLIAAVLGALYGGVAWIQAQDELDGRPYWILSLSTFALVATIYRLPDASISWAFVLVLNGALIFLSSFRSRVISILQILALLGLSALPYTPSWGGIEIFSNMGVLFVVFLFVHSLLIVGYIRHAFNKSKVYGVSDPWINIVFPVGLLSLLITHWVLSIALGLLQPQTVTALSFVGWLGLFSLISAIVIILAGIRGITLPKRISNIIRSLLSLEWIYGLFWWFYRTLSRLFSSISSILEGEGGVLWAILILILLISLLSQPGVGG